MSFEVVPSTSDNKANIGTNLIFPLYLITVSRNPGFFGREDILSRIDETFFSSEVRPDDPHLQTRTFAVCGPGGMGKTQTATAYVYTRKDRFDAIFWIHAASSAKLRDEFGRLAVKLGLIDENSVDARDQVITRDLVKGWLANPPAPHGSLQAETGDIPRPASWLLVFDNVDDIDVLQDFLPLGSPGCVLFTSRDPHAKHSDFLATAGVDLQPFNEKESSQLLQKLTRKRGDSSAVHERLGGLPLAITQMASVIIRRALSYTEFVESYDEEVKAHDSELLQANYPNLTKSNDYKETIWSVWAFQSLKHSRPLLDVLSFLDADGIPEIILTTTTNTVKILDGFPDKKGTYLLARAELLQSSLITKDSSDRRLVIHRLIQDAARAKMDPQRFRDVFSFALSLVSSVWQFEEFGWRHSISRWKLCEELMPHVLQLRRFGEQIEVQHDTLKTDYSLAKLLTDAGW